MTPNQDTLDSMELELLGDLPITPTSAVAFTIEHDAETGAYDVMVTVDGQTHRTGIGMTSQDEFDRRVSLFHQWASERAAAQ